jgi:hypothetical protein
MNVNVAFSDATPVFTCECAARCFGDSVNDAFASWWRHVADKHPGTFDGDT